jgi:hypothetical protein
LQPEAPIPERDGHSGPRAGRDLLAEANAARQAEQSRPHRRRADEPAARRSPLRWISTGGGPTACSVIGRDLRRRARRGHCPQCPGPDDPRPLRSLSPWSTTGKAADWAQSCWPRLSDRAGSEGIHRFTALVAADNAAAARLLRNMSAEPVRYRPRTLNTLALTEECSPAGGLSFRDDPLGPTAHDPVGVFHRDPSACGVARRSGYWRPASPAARRSPHAPVDHGRACEHLPGRREHGRHVRLTDQAPRLALRISPGVAHPDRCRRMNTLMLGRPAQQ